MRASRWSVKTTDIHSIYGPKKLAKNKLVGGLKHKIIVLK